MIFLENVTNQILLEEGQTLASLEDMGVDWYKLETFFENTYNQTKKFIHKYAKERIYLTTTPIVREDILSVRWITYDVFQDYNRIITPLDHTLWEFNEHSHEFWAFTHTNYMVEYKTYALCDYIDYSQTINNVSGRTRYTFNIPGNYQENTFKITQGQNEACVTNVSEDDENIIILNGTLGSGQINLSNFRGYIDLDDNSSSQNLIITFTPLYKVIDTFDISNKLFYIRYKANLLSMIAGIKEQVGNIDSIMMPFDFNRDGLLERARQLHEKADELENNSSMQDWWSF